MSLRIITSILLASVCAFPQCRVPVWADEFEGTEIDSSKWSFQTGGGGWGNQELENYTARPENATLRDGNLVITARRENYQGSSYTSARMRSLRKGDWRYGRFEARMKLPVGQGMWPAFWMIPSDSVYGGWPRSGEIDIMEMIGKFPGRAYATVHTANPQGQQVSFGKQMDLPAGTLSDKFHVFAGEWDAGRIRIFLDDQPYMTLEAPFPGGGTWPFDQKFYVIVNLAVGGMWPGAPDASTRFPQTLEVDYVRVFQKPEDIAVEGPVLVEPGTAAAVYQIPSLPGAVYQWTAPEGAVIEGASDGNSVAVNWGDAGGAVTLRLTTSCGETDLQLPVTVSPNLWQNPSFDEGFRLWNPHGAQANQFTFAISGDVPEGFSKSAQIEVLRAGVNPWEVQLTRPEIPLVEGQRYRLTFWGRSASGSRTVPAAFIDSRDFTQIATRTFMLDDSWRQFSYEFVASKTTLAQMNCDLARNTGVYGFTGFVFERIP